MELDRRVTTRQRIDLLPYYHRNLQDIDLDSINVTSGPRGCGKSNFSIYQAVNYLALFGFKCQHCDHTWVYHGKLADYNREIFERCSACGYDQVIGIPESRISMRILNKYLTWGEDIFEKVQKVEPFSPIVPDEAINFAMGEDWMFRKNKEIKRMFIQCRTKHLIFFLNVPRFDWLQSKYKDDMATAWFRIIKRGLCIMLIPDIGETDDSWHIDKFQKFLGHYNYLTDDRALAGKINLLKARHPCYYDHFSIPRVPEKIYANYLLLRNYWVFGREKSIASITAHKLMIFNLYVRWHELMQAAGKKKRPSCKTISNILLYDHSIKKPIIHDQSVRLMVNEMTKWYAEQGIRFDAEATKLEDADKED